MELLDTLREAIARIPVIDTHEHLPPWENEREKQTDFLREYLTQYMSSDLRSSGLSARDLETAANASAPVAERWTLVEPYWDSCRHTGYGRALDISVRAIYGVDGIRRQTIEALDEAFRASLKPGHFRRVMNDMCGIEIALLNAFVDGFDCDRSLFRRVWPPMHYIMPNRPHAGDAVLRLEEAYGLHIRTLDDWMHAFDLELDDALAHRVVAIKFFIAYERSLRFEKVEYSRAKSEFSQSLASWDAEGRKGGGVFELTGGTQDFMMHYILKTAGKKGVPFQFHTGLLEGSGNCLSNSDPCLMENLFLAYPDVRFDLFHIGYPFYGKAAALAKMFPNVFLDMCWAHIISPWAARQALHDFLDAVPFNKVSAFGGDYGFVDAIYGHLAMARENVARVLSEKVLEGTFSLDRAVDIARALFHDNPKRIFSLTDVK